MLSVLGSRSVLMKAPNLTLQFSHDSTNQPLNMVLGKGKQTTKLST